MKRQIDPINCRTLLLLGFVMTLAPAVAATPDGPNGRGGERGRGGETAGSVDVRLTARHQGAPRFRVMSNGETLQAGDEVRIEMAAEEESYAYIFHRGASGDWTLLFPNPDQSGDPSATNPLLPGEVCSVPGENSRLVLNDVLGTEDLVIYVLPRPDRAVTDLAVRLRRGEHLRIGLDDIPPDAGPALPSRQNLPGVSSEESKQSFLVAMRDLTFMPSQAGGEFWLPARHAVRFHFRNGGRLAAARFD